LITIDRDHDIDSRTIRCRLRGHPLLQTGIQCRMKPGALQHIRDDRKSPPDKSP